MTPPVRAALAAFAFVAAPAAAQMHAMPGMQGMAGMTMPAAPKPRPSTSRKAKRTPAARGARARDTTVAPVAACPPEHAAMGHCTPAAPAPDPAPAAAAPLPSGTDLPAGNAGPPAPPATLAAARFYGAGAMAAADRRMRAEHGGMRFGQVLFNLAEVGAGAGGGGYRWDGEAWFGGDIDRLVVKTEGEGGFGDRVDGAEVQALWGHAIGPYFDIQAGVRQDLGRGGRTYATLGVEGLAPYWFDVEATLFLSDRGDVLARVEGWHDARVTQRLILQPRVELNLAAQDVAGSRIAAGLSSAELGLRLRYEVRREFAPYAGLSWERRTGAPRGDRGGARAAIGIRGWF